MGELVVKHNCHEGKDAEYDSYIIDEDKIWFVLLSVLI